VLVSGRPKVTVEFYGMARQRAGCARTYVTAGTVAEALAAAVRACPGLGAAVRPDGGVVKEYLVSVNGQRFVRAGEQELREGDAVLVLGADAGG
jgi:molybdopterin converting factor small subunit